ncbi:MAG: 5,6-dimethylbenzimidazole synthase [Pseudomonadota bacterium]
MRFGDDTRAALGALLEWRRDVRHFRPEPLPEPLIDRLRAAMERAPSVGNARPWRVLRVEDPGLRASVRDEFRRANSEAAAGYEGERLAQYRALKLEGLETAPLQLAVFTETEPAEGHGLGRRSMPGTLRQSTAMAIHTLWLAARAENVGLGMVSILDPVRVESLCSAPAGWEFAAWLCLGWPEFDDDRPLLHRAGWQENTPTRWQRR